MNFGEQQNWESWRDVREWCEKNGYKNIVKRMDLNNDCWKSSGEFGRSQVEICDNLRLAGNEDEARAIADMMDFDLSKNYGLY